MTTIKSTIYGKAFEYACLLTIKDLIENIRPIEIEENSSYFIAKERFEDEIPKQTQKEMFLSAKTGIESIIDMEPRIVEDGKDILTICLQPDTIATQQGDIRDVLIIRRNIKWEIGISVKHNHSALKHSRLSRNLDFGNIWLGRNCSQEYFDKITPIFDLLDDYKKNTLKWSELKDKENEIYLPLLSSFKQEIERLNYTRDITSNLVKYLIGSNGKDYYKLISNRDNTTTVIPFNIVGTLNQSTTKTKPKVKIPKIKLPNKIIDFSFKENSNTTLILTLNNSWVISFRIHNASTYVESSLKFDIQLKGVPADIFYINKTWYNEL